jgi:hypothetical protein
MRAPLVRGLFATSRVSRPWSVDEDALFSDALAVAIGLALYVSLRKWSANRESRACVIACALVLLFHPAWTLRIVGDAEMSIWWVLTATCAGVWTFLHFVPPGKLGDRKPAPLTGPPDLSDTADQPPPPPAPECRPGKRMQVGFPLTTAYRLLAALGVGLFAHGQYVWYQHARSGWFSHPEPSWALGPLYFLLNASPADDWIGYALLAVAVPCLLSVVVRPNRWTALVASLTAWAWVIPGTVKALMEP